MGGENSGRYKERCPYCGGKLTYRTRKMMTKGNKRYRTERDSGNFRGKGRVTQKCMECNITWY